MHIGINSIAESPNRGCDSLIRAKDTLRFAISSPTPSPTQETHPIPSAQSACAIRVIRGSDKTVPVAKPKCPPAGRGSEATAGVSGAAVRHPAHPRSTYLYPNSFPIPKIPSIPKFPVHPKSLDTYRAVVLASEMYTHLVSDRRIRATIKSRLGERNQDQYVEGNHGHIQSHRNHR